MLDEKEQISRLPLKKAVTASGRDLEADDLISFLDGSRIRSVIRDSRDRLWISTWRDHVLVRVSGEKKAFDVILALQDTSRYVFIALGGEHCEIHNIKVEIEKKDYKDRIFGSDPFTCSQLRRITNLLPIQIQNYFSDLDDHLLNYFLE